MPLTRRTFLGRLSALAAGLMLPLQLRAAPSADFASRLQHDLSAIVPPDRTQVTFEIRRCDMVSTDAGNEVHATALVTMRWQPGVRRRGMTATGKTPEAAYRALSADLRAHFSEAFRRRPGLGARPAVNQNA